MPTDAERDETLRVLRVFASVYSDGEFGHALAHARAAVEREGRECDECNKLRAQLDALREAAALILDTHLHHHPRCAYYETVLGPEKFNNGWFKKTHGPCTCGRDALRAALASITKENRDAD